MVCVSFPRVKCIIFTSKCTIMRLAAMAPPRVACRAYSTPLDPRLRINGNMLSAGPERRHGGGDTEGEHSILRLA